MDWLLAFTAEIQCTKSKLEIKVRQEILLKRITSIQIF